MSKFDKLTKARSQLIVYHPFFGSLLLRLPMVEDTTGQVPTMGTNGKTISYNKDFVETLSVEELIGTIIHELYHIIFEHVLRKGTRDHVKWNIAGDYAINLIVRDAKFVLPKQVLLDDKYVNMNAETIYKKLPDIKTLKLPNGWNIGDVQQQKGQGGKAMSDQELEEASGNIKSMVKDAALSSKMAGKLPADLERMLKDLLEPKIPWKEILSKFLVVHVMTDYTWRIPNARYIPMDVYLPKLSEPDIGDLVLVCDTSGSISETDLQELMSEVKGILVHFPHKTFWLLGCDTRVASAQEVSFQDEIHKPKGGGGTCYKEPFKWVEKMSIDPVALIYLTDGECNSFPDKAPDYPVLWVLTKSPSYYKDLWTNEKVKFGEVVIMNEDGYDHKR